LTFETRAEQGSDGGAVSKDMYLIVSSALPHCLQDSTHEDREVPDQGDSRLKFSSLGHQGVVRLAVWPCLVCIVDEFMSPPGAPHCSTVPRPPGVISEELASCITSTSQLPPSLISSEFLQSSISLLVIFQI